MTGDDDELEKFLGSTYAFKDNHRGIRSVRFERAADDLFCTLAVPAGEQRIPVGIGAWKRGEMRVDTQTYESLGAYVGVQKTAASAGVGKDGTLRLRIYFTGATGYIDVVVSPDGKATGSFFAMNGANLAGL